MNKKVRSIILIALLGLFSGNTVLGCCFGYRRSKKSYSKRKRVSREARIISFKVEAKDLAQKLVKAIKNKDDNMAEQLDLEYKNLCDELVASGQGSFVEDFLEKIIREEIEKERESFSSGVKKWLVKVATNGAIQYTAGVLIPAIGLFVLITLKKVAISAPVAAAAGCPCTIL